MDKETFIEHHQRQKQSGLTVKEFCSNEIIAPSTFYYWQKKLRLNKKARSFIPLVVHEPSGIQPTASQGQQDETQIEIEFPNRTVLRLKNGANLSLLKSLIHLTD